MRGFDRIFIKALSACALVTEIVFVIIEANAK